MGLVELAKGLVERKPNISPEEFRGVRPIRNPDVTEQPGAEGSLLLSAPLLQQGSGMMGWIAKRMQAPDTKTFELEPVGAFVWSLCDGKHSFEAISRKLRDRFKMNRMEADASLSAFLRMLGQRRLISITMKARK